MQEDSKFLRFTKDYIFSSVSLAAQTVSGRSANGRTEWKLADDRTYADWETDQDNGSSPDGTSTWAQLELD